MSAFFTTLRLKLYDCWLSCLEAALPADRPSPLFGLLSSIFNGILLVWGCALIFSENCSLSSFRWVILGIIHAGINMFFAAAVMAVTRYKISKGIPIMTSTFYIFALQPVILIYIAYLIWQITWIVLAMQSAIYTTKDSCGHHIYVQVALLVAYLLSGAVVFAFTFMSTWGTMPEWRERANTCWNFNNRMARMANPSPSSRSVARVRQAAMQGRKQPMPSSPESFMERRRAYRYNNSVSNINNNNNTTIGHYNNNTISNHTISSGDVDNSSLHNYSVHSNANAINVNNVNGINKHSSRANLDHLIMQKERQELCQELRVSNYRNIPKSRSYQFDKYLQNSYHYNDHYHQQYYEQAQQQRYNCNGQNTLANLDKLKSHDNTNSDSYKNSKFVDDGSNDEPCNIMYANSNLCNYNQVAQQKEQQLHLPDQQLHSTDYYNKQHNAEDVDKEKNREIAIKQNDMIVDGIEEDARAQFAKDKVNTTQQLQAVNSINSNQRTDKEVGTKQITKQQLANQLQHQQQQQQQQQQQHSQQLPQERKHTDPHASMNQHTDQRGRVHRQ